jgi:hypothetical protein
VQRSRPVVHYSAGRVAATATTGEHAVDDEGRGGVSQGAYPFRDEEGREWVAVVYHEAVHPFSGGDRPGRRMIAFLCGVEEGVPAYEMPAPEAIPDTPSDGWWRARLAEARARRARREPLSA